MRIRRRVTSNLHKLHFMCTFILEVRDLFPCSHLYTNDVLPFGLDYNTLNRDLHWIWVFR